MSSCILNIGETIKKLKMISSRNYIVRKDVDNAQPFTIMSDSDNFLKEQ